MKKLKCNETNLDYTFYLMLTIQLLPEHSENSAVQKTSEIPSSVLVPRGTQKYADVFELDFLWK